MSGKVSIKTEILSVLLSFSIAGTVAGLAASQANALDGSTGSRSAIAKTLTFGAPIRRASPPSKQTKLSQDKGVYSSIDRDLGDPADSPTSPQADFSSDHKIAINTSHVPASTERKGTVQVDTGNSSSSPAFDRVPEGQRDFLLQRITLTEKILTRFGRAYDYRALTVSQLQSVLDGLEAQRKKDGQAVPLPPDEL